MPSILLLAYRNILERDRHHQVYILQLGPRWQASKAKAESVIRYISAKTFETANNLHGYVNGHKTGLNSHGTEWLSVILGEMIQTQTYPYVAE